MLPPIDIMFDESFSLMDSAFVCLAVGLVLEGRFRLVRVGPPCSSFSMAVNRFKMHAMRPWAIPDGFDKLTPVQLDKVKLGRARARVAGFVYRHSPVAGGHVLLLGATRNDIDVKLLTDY